MNLSLDLFKHCIVLFERSKLLWSPFSLGRDGVEIWLGYSYMPPVTSVAGGLYSIWQNIINSLELYEQSHRTGEKNK